MPSDPEFQSVANTGALQLGLKIQEFVGKGAFKETYRVTDSTSNTLALKIFDPKKCNRERSDREIDAIQRCNCAHIGKLYSFGIFSEASIAGILYSIEEFFDGGTLTSKCEARTLEPGELKSLGLAMTLALEHLKDLRLVHRDIKPDNIMYRISDAQPALVDFGLVRNLSEKSLTMSWLAHGPGTPMYSAPEQLNNEKTLIGWRTDQFSLGIVLAICAFGVHPYQDNGMSLSDAVEAVAARSKLSDRFIRRAEKNGMRCLIKMLEPWPIRRFNAPEELIEAMKEIGE
jgi:serine/threonine protein kinase